MTIAVDDAASWDGLVRALGLGPGLTFEQARLEGDVGPLCQQLCLRLAPADRAAVLRVLWEHGVPAVPAVRVYDTYDAAWHVATRCYEDVEHPKFGTVTSVRSYAQLSATPAGYERMAPLLGADTLDILRESGLSEPELDELLEQGVIGVHSD